MRTRVILSTKYGEVADHYTPVSRLPDDLVQVLARQGLIKLTLEYEDDRKLEYSAIEYPCDQCGQYGHSSENCSDEE